MKKTVMVIQLLKFDKENKFQNLILFKCFGLLPIVFQLSLAVHE